jgi:hypothetical protein
MAISKATGPQSSRFDPKRCLNIQFKDALNPPTVVLIQNPQGAHKKGRSLLNGLFRDAPRRLE